MIDPACLFLVGCWLVIKVTKKMNEEPTLTEQLTKDAKQF